MDIINDTTQETKVKVGGGGAGLDCPDSPLDREDPADWRLLPPGGVLKHSPLPPGPWTVSFTVNGHRTHCEVMSADSRVRLIPAGSTARVEIT